MHSTSDRAHAVIVQGHRGFRTRWPENTLAGFEAALQAGVDAIELDVGLTRDGVVVVSHDPALNPDLARTPDGAWLEGPGPLIAECSRAELRRFDVGRARPGGRTAQVFAEQQAVDGARIPTLAEVFQVAAGHAAMIDVELKTDPSQPGLTAPPARLAEAVVAVARQAAAIHRLALRAFDWRCLASVAEHWPELPLSWLSDSATEAASALWWGGPGPALRCLRERAVVGSTWAPDHRGLTAGQVAEAHRLGLRVIPWTVNDPADMARLIGWGVDGVCTDDPAMALRAVGAGSVSGPAVN